MISRSWQAKKSLCWPLTPPPPSSPLHWLAICLDVVSMTFSPAGQRSKQEQMAVEDPWENGCLFSSMCNRLKHHQVNYVPVFVGIEEDGKKQGWSLAEQYIPLFNSNLNLNLIANRTLPLCTGACDPSITGWHHRHDSSSLYKWRGFLFIFMRFPISHSRREILHLQICPDSRGDMNYFPRGLFPAYETSSTCRPENLGKI